MNDGPDMVIIPSGEMPSTKAATYRADYSGQHVESFEIGKYVVTLDEWLDVMNYLPLDANSKLLNQPVVNVNWFDVHRYIDELNKRTGEQYRLPTELEWEYAARAGTSNDYHVSRNVVLKGKVINYDRKNKGLVAVGSLPPNAWGCHEMLGNVWEWVSDGGRTVPGFKGFQEEYELNVLKGGCWASGEFEIQLSSRDEHRKEGNNWGTFGFRVAKDEKSSENTASDVY